VSAANENYPRRDPETACRSVADEGYLVVVPSRAAVEVLNPVGGKIYSMLDGKHNADDIVRALMDEFEVNAEQARHDLDAFLDELRKKGMLATTGGDGRKAAEVADD
jgi:dienelactone hydrolase